MPDISSSDKVSLPSYYLRVRTKHGEAFKRESSLIGRDEKSALDSVEKRFNDGESVDNKWEKYYLVKRYWILPVLKGAEMAVEEARLEIREKGTCGWTVRLASGFYKSR